MKDITQYKHIAKIYKRLMRLIDYSSWAEYLHDIFIDYELETNTVLELAAGTGDLSKNLKKYFDNVIVSDLSLPMLKMIDDNELPKICCDMTRLPFKRKFDFIISTFDSVNYLTESEQLRDLFREVFAILSDDGVFTFDVSLENNSLKHLKHLNRRGKYEGIKYIQKSVYSEEERIHRNYFTLSLDNGEIIEEVHTQRIYEFELYFDLLEEAGFYISECLDAFSFETGHSKSDRVQFVVRKN